MIPNSGIQYGRVPGGGNLVAMVENPTDPKIKNNMPNVKYADGKNQFGDLTISYHTMTGFMAAFMEMITSFTANGMINKYASLFESVDPFLCRLATLNPSESSFVFSVPIESVSLVDVPPMESTLPKYNREQNIDFFYDTVPVNATRGFSYTPTRINLIDEATYRLYANESFKLAGYR